MKKVLVIGYIWPEPDSSAAGRYMLSIMRLFRQQNWHVEFASPAQPTAHMIDLTTEGITTQPIKLNCDRFDHYISRLQPDIVLFDRFMMEEQFGWRVDKCCPLALKILDTEDLQCLRHARHQALKARREMTKSDLFSDLAKREIAAILRCDLSLIISSFEMELLTSEFSVSADLLHHLPFMVDLASCPDKTLTFSQRQHFMTIGNFRHAPNWDAVLQLQKLWPKIKKQIPDAQCHIYGAYTPPKATALHNPSAGFIIKGWAENVYHVMEKSRVCLAPLRFGAGIKGKLLDAMIMQTPSVTTDIGCEGMGDRKNWPGIIAENDEQFVEAAVELYQNEARWQQKQNLAPPLLQAQFDVKKNGQRLIKRIEEISQNLSQHRLNNFSGAMLKHHTMRSTQYMAQWIEAKNKNR